MDAVMRLDEVTKTDTAGGAATLNRVSLKVAPGERVAVTGPSGSGKPTALHLISGLDKPSRGTIARATPSRNARSAGAEARR